MKPRHSAGSPAVTEALHSSILGPQHVGAPILPQAIQDAAVLRHAVHALEPLLCQLQECRAGEQRV